MSRYDFKKAFAGVAQHSERRSASHPEVVGENPAPRSIFRAAAAGLQLDPETKIRGFADGLAGTWSLTLEDMLGSDVDVLAYSHGFAAGDHQRRKN